MSLMSPISGETPSESSNILQSSNPVLKATGVPISLGHKSLCVAASLVARLVSSLPGANVELLFVHRMGVRISQWRW